MLNLIAEVLPTLKSLNKKGYKIQKSQNSKKIKNNQRL